MGKPGSNILQVQVKGLLTLSVQFDQECLKQKPFYKALFHFILKKKFVLTDLFRF